jgi:hypothetical protein
MSFGFIAVWILGIWMSFGSVVIWMLGT